MDKKTIVYNAKSLLNLPSFQAISFKPEDWHHALVTMHGVIIYIWDTREIVHYHALSKECLHAFYADICNRNLDFPEHAIDNHEKLVDSYNLVSQHDYIANKFML